MQQELLLANTIKLMFTVIGVMEKVFCELLISNYYWTPNGSRKGPIK